MSHVSSHGGYHLSVAGYRRIVGMIGVGYNALDTLSDVATATETGARVNGEP